MWAKNLLFLGVILGGVALLRASLIPLNSPARVGTFDASPARADDFQEVVRAVDASFRTEWRKQDVEPAPRADDLQIARRLSLALTGTTPSLEEIRAFERQPEDTRLAGYVSNLLADRRYADYFAERLARAYVGTEDGPFIVFRRRRFVSWLGDELAANHSYDSIVRALIATEGMATDKPAVNFISVAFDKNEIEKPNVDRLAGRVARAFLGISLDCAQCHDHPEHKQWKQAHFQGLAAFFGQTHKQITNVIEGTGELEIEDRKTGQKRTIAPSVPFLTDCLPAEGQRRERLARWVTHPKNDYFARASVQRVWALLLGRPMSEAVEDIRPDEELPHALDILAKDFVAHNYDMQRLIRLIVASEVYRLDSACDPEPTEAQEQAWAVFPMTRLRPEQVAGGILQSASVKTVNRQAHILVRLAMFQGEKQFVQRYGDTGADEFDGRGGTIPQALLRLNGDLVFEKTKADLVNAAMQIAAMAPDDRAAVETAYLAVLTRRPTAKEWKHFAAKLAGTQGQERGQRLEDLYSVLLNATETSWNH